MKALFLPFSPSLASVRRCLATAEAWRAAGHEAIFGISPERQKMVRLEGFDTHLVPDITSETLNKDWGMHWLDRAYCAENLSTELVIIRRIQPDLMVFDSRFTSYVSASLSDLPCASILTGNTIHLALDLEESVHMLFSEEERGVDIPWQKRIAQRRFYSAYRRTFRSAANRINPFFRAYDSPKIGTPLELLLGDLNLISDLPEFTPTELPDDCHILGPFFWSGGSKSTPWLGELDKNPLIYFNLVGAITGETLLVSIIEAFKDAPYQVIITTCNNQLPSDLESASNIKINPDIPGATIIEHCTAVFHLGDHETLMYALASGIPSLVLPVNPDQLMITRQAQAMGVAHILRLNDDLHLLPDPRVIHLHLESPNFRKEIDDLLANTDCLNTCQEFKKKIHATPGASAAVPLLEKLTQGHIIEITNP